MHTIDNHKIRLFLCCCSPFIIVKRLTHRFHSASLLLFSRHLLGSRAAANFGWFERNKQALLKYHLTPVLHNKTLMDFHTGPSLHLLADTWNRRVFWHQTGKLLNSKLHRGDPFGWSSGKSFHSLSLSGFLFALATFLFYAMWTRVQNAEAFWYIPIAWVSNIAM